MASVLGYNRLRDAIKDHVPDKFKNTLGNLMLESISGENRLPLASGSGETATLDHNDKISVFISEAGLYKLVLKSKANNAEAFLTGSAQRRSPPSGRRAATWPQLQNRHHLQA